MGGIALGATIDNPVINNPSDEQAHHFPTGEDGTDDDIVLGTRKLAS